MLETLGPGRAAWMPAGGYMREWVQGEGNWSTGEAYSSCLKPTAAPAVGPVRQPPSRPG